LAERDALVQELLLDLAGPHIEIPDKGSTREEMARAVLNPIRALTKTDFGTGASLSANARSRAIPGFVEQFRATVVSGQTQHDRRGHQTRHPSAVTSEPTPTQMSRTDSWLAGLLRLSSGGDLNRDFADRVVDAVLRASREKGVRPRR